MVKHRRLSPRFFPRGGGGCTQAIQIHNQTCNYLCAAVFPEAIPAIITKKMRGLHVITDFRPPKKNMRMSTEHPSCPKSLLTWNCLGRQSRSASAFQQGALYTVYISRLFFRLFLLISNFNKPESESLQHCT